MSCASDLLNPEIDNNVLSFNLGVIDSLQAVKSMRGKSFKVKVVSASIVV